VEAVLPRPLVAGSQPQSTKTPQLVLVRGLPGSGKSTLARQLAAHGWTHLEADQFFETSAGYVFDGRRVRDAHAWCQAQTRRALAAGSLVVVTNTFTRVAELAPYLAMGAVGLVLHATGGWESVRGVPQTTLQRMAERWEPLPADASTRFTRRNLPSVRGTAR